MKIGGKGGGNTKTGLVFEGKTDLTTFLSGQKNYEVQEDIVYYKNELVARIFKKYSFYKFLEAEGVDWKIIVSKRLLPDDSIYVIINNTMFIIECKFQQSAGSVDEKLQTCDFKKRQYQKKSQLPRHASLLAALATHPAPFNEKCLPVMGTSVVIKTPSRVVGAGRNLPLN